MTKYVGRFAPSPTGELHLGSLVCAVASYVDARAHNGKWLLRIEDLDPPREPAGAAEQILEICRLLELIPDEDVVFQSDRHQLYHQVLERLKHDGKVYGCSCSRKEISLYQKARGLPENVYPGICRNGLAGDKIRAWRFQVPSGTTSFTDRLYGQYSQDVENEVGDFVLKRADGFWAYQLAVVVDDAAQGVTHVVRGSDLLDNTPRQILLQKALKVATPSYLHLPLVLAKDGKKLSKQNGATPLDKEHLETELTKAWTHLGFDAFSFSSPTDFYQKAVPIWKRSKYFGTCK